MSRQYDPFDEKDDAFDASLRKHLAAKLDAQRGRARRAFEAHVGAERTRDASLQPARPLWVIGVAGSMLAASIAALWAIPFVRDTGDVPLVTDSIPDTRPVFSQPAPQAVALWEPVAAEFNCVSENKGVLVLDDNTPVRVVEQYEIERVQYRDNRGVLVELLCPRQTTTLMQLETH
jgi:hypothetical protein